MKLQTTIIAAALALCSCGGNQHKASDPLADSGRTARTEQLSENLKALGDSSVYLFGQHEATVYGIGWETDYANDSTVHSRSDVKSVCNDFPALLGFDLGHIEQGDERNLYGVPFSRIRLEVFAHYDRGGLVSLSWTVNRQAITDEAIQRVAEFINSLETPYGVRVPVLFRLRETSHDVSPLSKIITRMKENGVTNALYVYDVSLEPDGDEARYMEHYPGDDLIDVMGLDCYCSEGDVANFAAVLDRNLTTVCAIAKQHHKAIALTETGFEGIKTDDWWTATLAPILSRHPVSYVLVWRNAHDKPGHFFAPYPGHPSTSDFIRFYNAPQTLFLRDVNALYLP